MIETDLAKLVIIAERTEAEVKALRAEVNRIRRADGPVLKRQFEVVRDYKYKESTLRLHIKQGLVRATKRGRVVLIDVSQFAPVGDDQIAALAAKARAR
jgi:hypothetical protein